ncbi:5-dehydro-2-deoxygluconokinase [Rhizobium beringeri]
MVQSNPGSQPEPALDVITIGRSSVDLYGQQIGSRLEDIGSFAKSVGGCPANIAIGTARLGLKSGLITRVGDEQMGRFIREQSAREGVATDGIVTDKERLTALVLLAVEAEGVSPMIFYRSDCADMALDEGDIDEDFIRSSRAVLVSGTHFSRPNTEAAQRKAIRIAKANGRKVIFDIDYRPNLWGLAGHAEGFERYVKSDRVSSKMKETLPDCDLIVGTEEEILIASGADDVLGALKEIRRLRRPRSCSSAAPWAASSMTGRSPTTWKPALSARASPIEVFNVLGAGDAFMSGFLRGFLRDEQLKTCATWANACGAFAVSPPALLAGISDLGGTRLLPDERQQTSGAAQGRGDQPHPLGIDPARRNPAFDGAGDRPPFATRQRRR